MEGRVALVPADFLIGPDLTISRRPTTAGISAITLSLSEIESWLEGEYQTGVKQDQER